jgi:Cu+-exporting ATPase
MATKAIKHMDPVCKMEVEPGEEAGKSVFQGKTYYFCSDEDKQLFDKNPEKYVKAPAHSR